MDAGETFAQFGHHPRLPLSRPSCWALDSSSMVRTVVLGVRTATGPLDQRVPVGELRCAARDHIFTESK